MMENSKLLDSLLSFKVIAWQNVLEDIHKMIGCFHKIQLILFDGVTKERCIASYLLARSIISLGRKSGYLFVALYLKQCSNCLMIYRGESRPQDIMAVSVSTTKSGLPRIIPPFHRRKIREGTYEGDQIIRWYLSLFSLSKIIRLAKKPSLKGISSITKPLSVSKLSFVNHLMDFADAIPKLAQRYLTRLDDIRFENRIFFKPTWKSLPSHGVVSRREWESYYPKNIDRTPEEIKTLGFVAKAVSCFTSLIDEVQAWLTLEYWDIIYEHQTLGSEDSLIPFITNQKVLDPPDDLFHISQLDCAEIRPSAWSLFIKLGEDWSPYLERVEAWKIGKLGCLVEGAGKRRVFAIGNYLNQRILWPVHSWVMRLLRTIPMDGTFDQEAPIVRLAGMSNLYSFDLSSATDRLPIAFQLAVLHHLLGHEVHSDILSRALCSTPFRLAYFPPEMSRTTVYYTVGQPMGYYSSWALFTITHHFLVWYAADQVYPGRKFMDYGILGDDLVIANTYVANRYRKDLDLLGVDISLPKSLRSTQGSLEFAKRFWVDMMSLDLSPISFKCLLNYFHPFGLYAISQKYPILRFSTFCRIGGIGWKTLSRLTTKRNKTILKYKALWNRSRWPLKLWLADGGVLCPYVEGRLAYKLLMLRKPRDLRIPPPLAYRRGLKEEEFVELMLIRHWMADWVKYMEWYYNYIIHPQGGLEYLCDEVPIVTTRWYRTSQDESLLKFGFPWKAKSLIDKWKSQNWRPKILASTQNVVEVPFIIYLGP